MILYHGSNIEVANIDLSRCQKFKDFGQGFYLTSIKEQACDWAKKVVRRSGRGAPILNEYEFDDEMSGMNAVAFDYPDENWATFIINNRNERFTDHGDKLSNHDNKYDIVHGLVANDDISTILETFLMGILPMSELPKALIYKKLNDQYSFHTDKAVTRLTFLKGAPL